MKRITLFTLIMSIGILWAQMGNPFGNLRHSSRNPNGDIHIRFDGIPGMDGYSLYYTSGDIWQEADLDLLGDPADNVYEALVPYEFGDRLRYRLHNELHSTEVTYCYLHPAYLQDSLFPPELARMAKIGDDPVGDVPAGLSPDLDITGNYMAMHDDRIYRAIENQTGSFSLMQSITSYNLYLSVIVNPDALVNNVVYAMLYTFNIPGMISPGLYKLNIDLNNPSFERLGDIQSTISDGILHMSCDLSILLADPDFGPWPNSTNMLMMEDITLKLGIDLISQEPDLEMADLSSLGLVECTELIYEVAENTLPTLKIVDFDPDQGTVELIYLDAEGDFPLDAQVHINNEDGGFFYMDMIPTYNPDGSVSFFESAGEGINYRVSDNLMDYVVVESPAVSIQDEQSELIPALLLSMPNPLDRSLPFCELKLDNLDDSPISLTLYNVRGQKLSDIATINKPAATEYYQWQAADFARLKSGIYFIRITQSGRSSSHKFSIIN